MTARIPAWTHHGSCPTLRGAGYVTDRQEGRRAPHRLGPRARRDHRLRVPAGGRCRRGHRPGRPHVPVPPRRGHRDAHHPVRVWRRDADPPPPGTGRYAGLIVLSLPPVIRKGESFDVLVHQIHDRTVFITVSVPPGSSGRVRAAAAASEGDRRTPLTWREVLGTFQLTIPISGKEVLLRPE